MTVLGVDSLRVLDGDGRPLIDDVSLGVEAGETLLLCGGPGSGKTLLAKALVGLLEDRDDLRVEGSVERAGEVGFVFQYPARQLVRRTARLDIGFGLENRGVDPGEIADRVTEVAGRFDATGLLDRRVGRLSAGETTVVALLGVLVTEPDVVVLDEPFSTLDYPGTRRLLEAIDRLRSAGTAVVIAEHDVRDLLGRADRVVNLDGGRVAADGPPEAVASALNRQGVTLPFRTRIALERGGDGERPLPLAADGPGDEGP
ncbi:MAG: ABC transporter ATP-binding protein [Halobacteriales archaeon]|nr:ABC transporter ATP-binding protein [Halobacteriales archaeon]